MLSQNPKSVKKVQKYTIFDTQIGTGSSGTVYLGCNVETKQLVAVKVFSKSKLDSQHRIIREHTIKNIKREASIQKQLRNKNIVAFYDVFETNSSIYFFLEYCQQTLENYMNDSTHILTQQYEEEERVRKIFIQILNAFLYLQNVELTYEGEEFDDNKSRDDYMRLTFGAQQRQQKYVGICHRDLKPCNILVLNDRILLGDFGLCRDLTTLNQTIGMGTPLYMSPISLQGQQTCDFQKSDVWASGIILFEMLYKKHPWKPTPFTTSQLLHNILNKSIEYPKNQEYSTNVQNLLQGMLAIPEMDRLSWDQIAQHPWINGAPNNQIESLEDTFSKMKIDDIDLLYQLQ